MNPDRSETCRREPQQHRKMTDNQNDSAEAADGMLPARSCSASFVVRDLTGEAQAKIFRTMETARQWHHLLFEVRPNSRCVIEEVPNDGLPTDNLGRLYCWDCWFRLQKSDPRLHNTGDAETCGHCGKIIVDLTAQFRGGITNRDIEETMPPTPQ